MLLTALVGCATDGDDADTDDTDVADATGDVADLADTAVDPPDLTSTEYVRTPNGLVHASCVQEVGNDDVLDEDGTVTRPDGSQYVLRACDYPTLPEHAAIDTARLAPDAPPGVVPTDNGWIESAWWHAPHWLRRLHANFRVPSNPSSSSTQTVFLFPSFEPGAGNAIVQPVLQWGPSAAGGGRYWAISSWYVWPGHSAHGPLKRVKVDDILYGSITGSSCTSAGKCKWTIVTTDKTHAATSKLVVNSAYVYTELQGGVLEAYNVNSCAKYPANGVEAFYNLAIADGGLHALSPHFAKLINKHTCHESEVVSPKTVFLNF